MTATSPPHFASSSSSSFSPASFSPSTISVASSGYGSGGGGGSDGGRMSSKKSSLASNSSALSGNNGSMDDRSSVHDLVPAGMARAGDALPVISPSVTKVGESFRQNVPHEMQCSMFCGGRKCKYETGSAWKPDQMAIKGIFSHWVTDRLLAMARPNTALIREGGLLDEFKKHGIKSIINLQTPGEHASCGPKLDKSGFSYDPNDFMKNDIFFYNFAWKDFGDATMNSLLDMVKVLSFALSEGAVAVHCHAGLGRTGVLIAAYLVYYLRVRSNDALRYLRLKRPGAVQTRKQIDCVKEFETFFLPQCLVFSNKVGSDSDRKTGKFTVDQHIKRQRLVIHGYEARTLKYIPKIIHRICERLLKLSGCGPEYAIDSTNFTKQFYAFRYDNKGSKILGFGAGGGSSRSTPSDSMAATRRSSRTLFNTGSEDDAAGTVSSSMAASVSSSGFPTPSYGGTRPGSETNSYVQSCSSALSGVDDRRLDEILGDGIQNQTIGDNSVTKELASHENLQAAVAEERLPKVSADDIYRAAMDSHAEIMRRNEGSWATQDVILMKQYRTELNFKLSAWDRIDAETNLFVLTALLFEWLEHLKSPVLDKDGITYVVIYCDNIDAALKRLPNTVCYIVEYLARFVARLQPLDREKSEHLMLRMVASLTHQSVEIDGTMHPSAKKFPKLRNNTAESTKKFMMQLFDVIKQQEQRQQQQQQRLSVAGGVGAGGASSSSDLSNFRFTTSTFNSLNASSSSMITHASASMMNNGGLSAVSPGSPDIGGSTQSVNAVVHTQPTPAVASANNATTGLSSAGKRSKPMSGRRSARNNNHDTIVARRMSDEGAADDLDDLDNLEADLPPP